MKLIFDIGNTRIKWALWDGAQLTNSSVLVVAGLSSIHIEQAFKVYAGSFTTESVSGLTGDQAQVLKKIESIWVSNVGSVDVLQKLAEWFQRHLSLPFNVVEVARKSGELINGYKSLELLGVDRWMAAIGARKLLPNKDVIIIDAGTAVTIDWLSDEGRFEGGVILPGFDLMRDGLLSSTESIDVIHEEFRFPIDGQIIGRDTSECVNYGISLGLIGGIEKIVTQMKNVINRPVSVVLTGGSASLMSTQFSFDVFVQSDLVLLGVIEMAEQN